MFLLFLFVVFLYVLFHHLVFFTDLVNNTNYPKEVKYACSIMGV